MKNKETLVGVYSLLAEVFKEPTPEMVAELPQMNDFLQEASAALGYDILPPGCREWLSVIPELDNLRNDYIKSFVHPPDTRVVPVESVYRQWTFDDTAKVPFAKEKGYLMSDAALHMQELYRQYGLSIPEVYHAMPDHLCLELEFAAFLLEQKSGDRQAVFLQEHLSWLNDLYKDAEQAGIPDFYRQAIQVTTHFLSCELAACATRKPDGSTGR